MKNVIIALLLSFPIVASTNAQSASVMEYFARSNVHFELNEVSVSEFPFDQYVSSNTGMELESLESDRLYLSENFLIGDSFIYHLFDYLLKSDPVTPDNLESKLEFAENLIHQTRILADSSSQDIYLTVGYFILGKIANTIEEGLRNEQFDISSIRINNLRKRLNTRKIYLSVRPSSVQKLGQNILEGNFAYIFKRTSQTLDQLCASLSCRVDIRGSYIFYFLVLLVFCSFLSKRKKIISSTLFLFIGMIGLSFGLPNCDPVESFERNDNFKSSLSLSPSSANSRLSKGSYLYEIEENEAKVGEVVWMNSSMVDVYYTIGDNAKSDYKHIKENADIILATTGGYSTMHGQPDGLMLERGEVIGGAMLHDRHGLVMISENDQLRIADLTSSLIQLPFNGPIIENPLNSLIAFSKMLSWADKERITLFQTHLLVSGNKILIPAPQKNSKVRERRVLVACSERNTLVRYSLIFNFSEAYGLYDLTKGVFEFLKGSNMSIHAMINLDVGSFDILNVFDKDKNLVIRRPVDIDLAENLIIYTTKD